MYSLKCPIYNDTSACDKNRNCLWLRTGGCAIVLAATIGEENSKRIKQLESEISHLSGQITNLQNMISRLK